MSVPTFPTVAQLETLFVQTYVATLDPGFGATVANIPQSDAIWALAFASAALGVQQQKNITDLYTFSRASTATGQNLDSWFADFGFQRFQGSEAQATVTIPTSNGQNTGTAIPIPAGTPISTQPIILSPSTVPSIYSFTTVSLATIAAGTSSITVGIEATAVGSSYNNIPSNTPLSLGTAIPGVGVPTFLTAPTLGANEASDALARQEFIGYITSLQEGTLAAVIAAVQDASGLQNGVNLTVYDYATAPTKAAPGQVIAAFIESGKSGQYVASPSVDPIAQEILLAMQNSVAFGMTPIVWYATQYAISAFSIPLWSYSASGITAAGITAVQLQGLMLAELQTLFPSGGTALGISVPFSQIVRALLDISVTNASGNTVTGLVSDVYLPSVSVTTAGGTFLGSTNDSVQGGTPGLLDPYGYLSMALTVAPFFGVPTQTA